MASMAILTRKFKPLSKTLNPRFITTYSFLSQQPQLADHPPPPPPSPLPPSPATGSPLYNENWRNPHPNILNSQSLIPLGFSQISPSSKFEALSKTLDRDSMSNVFADWMTSHKWGDIKMLFEKWIRCLDYNGKPNKPDVGLFNHYLRANLMMGVSAGDLLGLVSQMDDYNIVPNTASFNLVLKAMYQAKESEASVKLIDRMIQTGKESKGALPDDESYHLVVRMLLEQNQVDAALKYIDLTLNSGYMLSAEVFSECVRCCGRQGRLDTLLSIIERCKKMDQNKALCPPWNLCNDIVDVAIQSDNSELAFYGLEFIAKWIARGEIARPPVLLSVDEGLVVNALTTAGRNYNSKLLDGAWAVLKRSLRQKKVPSPESYIAKIFAYSSFGNLQKAFSTLHEFETAYKGSAKEVEEDMFSPFTTLYPLVMACSKNGFTTLDSVYYQLENLSRADPPYKSVAAVNCVILGCANIWDVDRAYQTFSAMESSFGLTPDVHSYNALLCAFGKLHKRDEAVKVFEHMVSLDVKPNTNTYALLVDAHLTKRDTKGALSSINDMVVSGFRPTKEILKKVRRRCVREMDYETNDKVGLLAKEFNIRLGSENRREILFNLEFSTEYA
uniref:pentatricopeptide repeat-containing protein At1g26460, mitochondrial n=1 Tax=Erigeron canadensis TaxID=72917 RepID=UPI001CB8CC51|nr:pentatricopeptide repeat-containing protein At1g26460, mitochondrial [Erigeron canadensis]XP_043613324.1 pentatricopeptide repeat-containing protein At1g26460, mitochondrial [Erigeron canadensis]